MALEIERASIRANTVKGSHIHSDAQIARTQLAQTPLAEFPVNLTDFRVHDAVNTPLPSNGTADDLGIISSTLGVSGVHLRTNDLQSAGSTTQYARAILTIPQYYSDGEDAQIRIRGGFITTIADLSGTCDVQAYKIEDDGSTSADLVATAAQSFNSLTFVSKDFILDASDLAAGDRLDTRIAVLVWDAAGVQPVYGAVQGVSIRCDVRP